MSIYCQETVSLEKPIYYFHSLSLILFLSLSLFPEVLKFFSSLFFFFSFSFLLSLNNSTCPHIWLALKLISLLNPQILVLPKCVCGQGGLKIIPQAAATVVWVCFPIISDNPTRSDTAGRGNVEEPRPDFCSGQHTCSSPSSLIVTVRNKLLWSIFSVL